MTTGTLDRRLVVLLAGSVGLMLVLRFGVYGDRGGPVVVAAAESIPQAEQRLDQLRRIAGTLDGKEALKKQADAELASREKGLIPGGTIDEARAKLLELTTNIAKANGIDTKGMDDHHEKAVSADYAEVAVTVSFTCAIENLVNFLAALADQPEILATNEIRVSGGNDKKKNVQVRIGVAGLVPRKLLPEKKGLAGF